MSCDLRTNVSHETSREEQARAVAHMTLPERNTRRHDADEAPRANPCARGIDRNNRRWRGRFRHPAVRPCAARQTARGIRKHAERRRDTRPRRPARNASARQRRYVPSRNACAYSTIVERLHHAKSSQIPLRRRTDVSRETSGRHPKLPHHLACTKEGGSRAKRGRQPVRVPPSTYEKAPLCD